MNNDSRAVSEGKEQERERRVRRGERLCDFYERVGHNVDTWKGAEIAGGKNEEVVGWSGLLTAGEEEANLGQLEFLDRLAFFVESTSTA